MGQSLPCAIKPCVPKCDNKVVTQTFFGFSFSYTTKVCGEDTACKANNARCHGMLLGLMKAAVALEEKMKTQYTAVKLKGSSLSVKSAAKKVADAEKSKAKTAMDAASAEYNAASQRARSL